MIQENHSYFTILLKNRLIFTYYFLHFFATILSFPEFTFETG